MHCTYTIVDVCLMYPWLVNMEQRALAKQTTQENLKADVAPFAFPAANKGEPDELREAAYMS